MEDLDKLIEECINLYYEKYVEGMPAVYFILDGGFVEKSRRWRAMLDGTSVECGTEKEGQFYGTGLTRIDAVKNLLSKL